MVIDKLYAVTLKSKRPVLKPFESPRQHAESGVSNTRLADGVDGKRTKLQVPDVLKTTSVSEFFAKLEQERINTAKS